MARTTKADLEKRIVELEHKVDDYKKWLMESEERYNKLVDEKEAQLELLPIWQQMKNHIDTLENIKKANEDTINRQKKIEDNLRNKIQEFLKENKQPREESINNTMHNARGAGRKHKPEELIVKQLSQIDSLLKEGLKQKEICQKMNISKSTFYRLKKSH